MSTSLPETSTDTSSDVPDTVAAVNMPCLLSLTMLIVRVPRIRENYHQVLKIREIGSLQIHTGYLTLSLNKTLVKHEMNKTEIDLLGYRVSHNLFQPNPKHLKCS